ncbi:hypothetical protein [Sphingobium sp. CAP-1]|uniref:hypothetical protein n=1 Tax=Sphingobium sp. CAP-1 TaxID=2676077 RepID=UPI0012BB40B8|nr:hypothetical protein [Sphingobium sp. CAP-1]QGP79581.1 hypothetical protein GL174_11775 [Sphingobium sp. CAP-1]
MAGKGIFDAPHPISQYRIDSEQAQYETEHYADKEDRKRAKAVRRTARKARKSANENAADRLGHLLEYAVRGEGPPNSLASYGHVQEARGRIIPDIWRLHDKYVAEHGPGSVRTATVARQSWEISPSELSGFPPSRVLNRLRADLYRCGAAQASGAAIVGIHGEYEPRTGILRIHVHMILFGDMVEPVRRLRDLAGYRPLVRSHYDVEKRTPAIRISDKPLTNLPAPLSYILQPFWPSRWEGVIDGKWKRQGQKARIQGSAHTRVLLWLDRWELKDIVLLMGIRMGKYGLVLTH